VLNRDFVRFGSSASARYAGCAAMSGLLRVKNADLHERIEILQEATSRGPARPLAAHGSEDSHSR